VNILDQLKEKMPKKDFYKLESKVKPLKQSIKKGVTRAPDGFGLCSDCTYFYYRRSEHGTEVFYCDKNAHSVGPSIVPGRFDPIKVCTDYMKEGDMSLEWFWTNAIFIDLNKKDTIGFGLKNEVEVTSRESSEEDFVEDYD
jgi:hypothetical protein